nr:immunoglobulin light chain junction region [Macaca mulatta]
CQQRNTHPYMYSF